MFQGTVDWHNVDGVHTYAMNDVKSPLKDFDPQIQMRTDTSRDKPMMPGKWRTRSQLGNYIIHCEGTLFSTDSASYMVERKNLVLALFGVPDTILVDDYMGTLYVTPEGETEAWTIDCTITAFSSPIQGNYPSLTEYLVTFESFEPWFVGGTSGNKYIF